MQIYPPNYFAEEKDFPEAWQNMVRFCMKNGIEMPTEYGPKSKDMCSMISLTGNAIRQIKMCILHDKFPTKKNHLEEYLKQFTPEFDATVFAYTYYKRLTKYFLAEHLLGMNQLKIIKENLRNSRRLQAITWIPDFDLESEEPPCLQRLWIRVLQEPDNDNHIFTPGTVEYHVMWRSRDVYSAWMSNLVGTTFMVYNEILGNDYEVVKIVDFVNAAHIYETDYDLASKV